MCFACGLACVIVVCWCIWVIWCCVDVLRVLCLSGFWGLLSLFGVGLSCVALRLFVGVVGFGVWVGVWCAVCIYVIVGCVVCGCFAVVCY